MARLGIFRGLPITCFAGRGEQTYLPGWLDQSYVNRWLDSRVPGGVVLYDSLADYVRHAKPATIGIVRTFALGDIIMLLPILRAFHRMLGLSRPIHLFVGPKHLHLTATARQTDWLVVGEAKPRKVTYGCDVHMNLDRCLEADHWGGVESHRHRLELYGDALGMEVVNAARES